MSEIVCGIDPANYKGKCIPGVSLNSELCSYNTTTNNCNKKSKKTWAQIEADLKKGSPVVAKEVEKVMVPVEAVEQVAEELLCGVDAANFKGRCEPGVNMNTKYCTYNKASKRCNKGSKLTWKQIEEELKKSPIVEVVEKKSPAKEVAVVEIVEKKSPVKQQIVLEEQPKTKKLTPFFSFMAQNREQVKAENPTKSAKEIATLLGEMWRNLSAEEQAAYKEGAPEIAPKQKLEPKMCGFDLAKKNCVRGAEAHGEYCQEGEKGQCRKSDKYNKYTLDELARLIQGEQVADKTHKVLPCGFDVTKKNCVRGVEVHGEYCQEGLRGSCKKSAAYDKYSLDDIARLISGEEPLNKAQGKYCKLTANRRSCEDAEELEDDAQNCYYNVKTKKCTKRKVGKA